MSRQAALTHDLLEISLCCRDIKNAQKRDHRLLMVDAEKLVYMVLQAWRRAISWVCFHQPFWACNVYCLP